MPSPKFQLYVNPAAWTTGLMSVAVAVKLTGTPTVADGSFRVTVGATSLTVTVVLELPLCPAESVAVKVAVYVPGLA